MSVYGELDPMIEHRTQIDFKGKRECIAKVNMPNIAHPNQHIDTGKPHGSRDHVIIPNTVKITFNLDITSTDKAQMLEGHLQKKRCSCLVQKRLTRLITQTFMAHTRIFT